MENVGIDTNWSTISNDRTFYIPATRGSSSLI